MTVASGLRRGDRPAGASRFRMSLCLLGLCATPRPAGDSVLRFGHAGAHGTSGAPAPLTQTPRIRLMHL
jgi:hypothetical protein